jgi:hypothetical protein
MANEFDIFSISVGDLDTQENKTSASSDLYNPKPDQGPDGNYRSLIRFLPNLSNPRKPYIRKYIYWLENDNGGFYVDSPSTVGERCPVQDMFFKLRNSTSAVEKNLSETLKRREVYYALIQVVKDPQNRDLEGQIKIFKFGYKIKAKIDEELNPQFDEPVQVFDPFEGKNFELVLTKKGGYTNYDSSKFQGSRTPIAIGGEQMSDNPEDRKRIVEYLKKSPDISNFEYKPWTDEQRANVMKVLSSLTSPGSKISELSNSSKETLEISDYDSPKSKKSSIKEEVPTSGLDTSEVLESGGDDIDDFIAGLDL